MKRYTISLNIKGIFNRYHCIDDGTGNINAKFNIAAKDESDLKEKILELIDSHTYYNKREDVEVVFSDPLTSNTFKKLELF